MGKDYTYDRRTASRPTFKVHPLADTQQPQGTISFIHSDGKEHSYSSAVSTLTKKRFAWYDSNPPEVVSMSQAKRTFKNIREKSKKVLAVEGAEALVGR